MITVFRYWLEIMLMHIILITIELNKTTTLHLSISIYPFFKIIWFYVTWMIECWINKYNVRTRDNFVLNFCIFQIFKFILMNAIYWWEKWSKSLGSDFFLTWICTLLGSLVFNAKRKYLLSGHKCWISNRKVTGSSPTVVTWCNVSMCPYIDKALYLHCQRPHSCNGF